MSQVRYADLPIKERLQVLKIELASPGGMNLTRFVKTAGVDRSTLVDDMLALQLVIGQHDLIVKMA